LLLPHNVFDAVLYGPVRVLQNVLFLCLSRVQPTYYYVPYFAIVPPFLASVK
jgi:hypothetical protein